MDPFRPWNVIRFCVATGTSDHKWGKKKKLNGGSRSFPTPPRGKIKSFENLHFTSQ